MVDIDFHKSLIELVKLNSVHEITSNFIEVEKSETNSEYCTFNAFHFEELNEKIRIDISRTSLKIYKTIDDFLMIQSIDDQSNILILDLENPISYINNITYLSYCEANEFYLISNVRSYLEFQAFLKLQDIEIDSSFHYIDVYNKDSRKITFVSLADIARLSINYELKSPIFLSNKDFTQAFIRFKNCFNDNNKSLIRFLKSSTISVVSNFPDIDKFKLFFESLDIIINRALVNFEVYLNELSIDKIRKDYDEVKSKYFNSLSDILSKLTQNLLSLPIGICAILFAIDRVKSNLTYMLLIGVVVLLTSIFISLLIRANYKDLTYIKYIFNFEFNQLIGNNFFVKYPLEKNSFDNVKIRINDRIHFLKIVLNSFYWVVNCTNVLVLGSILFNANMGFNFISLVCMSIIICFALLNNYIFADDGSTLE